MDVNEMNLSLNGCGYLGIYHVGVCAGIKKYYPQILKNKISGGSVGALVACAFMCDVPLSICVRYIFDVSMKVRNGILGPMSPDLNIIGLLYDRMGKMIPPDAHLHCDGRLNVSVTRFDNGQNVLLNRFNSKEDLLQALMCSCFIPVYCGYEPPVFHGVAYVDAALSNNSPWLNEHTVTVAPFSGNSDICPENDGLFLRSFTLSNTSIGLTAKNMYMLFRVLFPGTPDIQQEFCQKGYNDALRFLRDNDLVPCPDCLKTKTSHAKCKPIECPLPKEITDEFDHSIQEFRKNLGYRLLQYRSMKVLYYMNIPSIVTAKVAYVVISTILQKFQNKAGSCVDDVWSHFLQVLKEGLYGSNGRMKSCVENKALKDKEDCSRTKTNSEFSSKESNSVICDDCVLDSTTKPLSTDVEIEVPENNSAPFMQKEYAVKTRNNGSCKLDLNLCDNKTNRSAAL